MEKTEVSKTKTEISKTRLTKVNKQGKIDLLVYLFRYSCVLNLVFDILVF